MIESIPYVLTGIGIIISILYYTSVLRNAEKSRKIDQIFQRFQSIDLEWLDAWATVAENDYETIEDWYKIFDPKTNKRNYSEWNLVALRFDLIGVMLKEEAIDAEMIFKMYNPWAIMRTWEKMSPFLLENRRRINSPLHRAGFEYLYNTAKKMHPDIITTNR